MEPIPEENVKYVCVRLVSSGFSLDPATLGGETALELNSDGTASFTVGGKEEPGCTWVKDSGTGRVTVKTADGKEMEMVAVEDGFEINYRGMMDMTFAPEA